jgi:anti-sigma factor RsiW
MKDARFKELLNLHLDHRLSPAEAEELEAGLREDPARRRALRDYEAMQSACAALFARCESRAPSSEALRRALRQAESRMEHPRSLRDAWGWPTWGVTGGLAACVALVVARLSQPALVTAKAPEAPEQPPGPMLAAIASTQEPVLAGGLPADPSPITFAALGLTENASNALTENGSNADAASRWILQADEPVVYATLAEASAAGETMQAWSAHPSQSAPPVHFISRPINAWSHSGSSGQVETAAFRFER